MREATVHDGNTARMEGEDYVMREQGFRLVQMWVPYVEAIPVDWDE